MHPQIEQGALRRLHSGDDLPGYSDRQPHVQRGLLEAIAVVRERAARIAGMDRAAAYTQSQGDGEFVRWPSLPSTLEVIHRYPAALCNELIQANASRSETAALGLRLAMVEALSEAAPGGLSGDPFVMVRRFLDCWQAREALALIPDCPLAVVVDQGIFRDTVAKEFLGLRPDQYVEILVRDEEKRFEAPAWLTLPGSTPAQVEAVREHVGVGVDVGVGPDRARTAARPSRPAPARTARSPRPVAAPERTERAEGDAEGGEADGPPAVGRSRRSKWLNSALAVALVGAIGTVCAPVIASLLGGGDDDKRSPEAPSPTASVTNVAPGVPGRVRWTDDGGSTLLRSYVSPEPRNTTPSGRVYPAGETLTLVCRVTKGRSIDVGAAYSGPDPDSTVWYRLDDGAWVPAVYVDPGSTSVPMC
ncbi:hypothetical protein ACODT3_07140 [Streptomyces sp. 4.24]|uniref:hypothetical protein n=1 Tax=Streptomyces tritrimontium TaxID=3406573 RepID=UPI003BB50875